MSRIPTEPHAEPHSDPRSRAGSAVLPVFVNGEPHELPAGSNVRALLVRLGLEGRRIAVAVNRTVVPRSAYDSQPLAAGDRVEILEAVGGG